MANIRTGKKRPVAHMRRAYRRVKVPTECQWKLIVAQLVREGANPVLGSSEKPVPEVPTSHPAWCSRRACTTYLDHDGTTAYVIHAGFVNGVRNYVAALSQREVLDAAGHRMELDEANLTVRRNGEVVLHLPAREARKVGHEMRGVVGAVVLIALGVLDQAS